MEEFKPCAAYYPGTDAVVYLTEDVSYRADRVDGALEILWHPTEQRVVGIKMASLLVVMLAAAKTQEDWLRHVREKEVTDPDEIAYLQRLDATKEGMHRLITAAIDLMADDSPSP